MKTCEDCMHFEVCCYVVNNMPICDSFKDKSKFLELPCSIGDTVYEIQDIIEEDFCAECEYYMQAWPGDPDCCEITDCRKRPTECLKVKEKEATLQNILRWMLNNKTVFLAQEDALHELRRRIVNGESN